MVRANHKQSISCSQSRHLILSHMPNPIIGFGNADISLLQGIAKEAMLAVFLADGYNVP